MTTPLFLDSEHKLTFKKIAMPVKLTDDPAAWQREIASEVYKQLPFLGEYAVNVVLERVDAQRGYALGSAQVTNHSQAPTPEQESLPSVRIPIIVRERMMMPLDVFMDGSGVYPLSASRVRERLFRTDTFEGTTRKPVDRGMIEQLYPPDRNSGAPALSVDAGVEKMAGEMQERFAKSRSGKKGKTKKANAAETARVAAAYRALHAKDPKNYPNFAPGTPQKSWEAHTPHEQHYLLNDYLNGPPHDDKEWMDASHREEIAKLEAKHPHLVKKANPAEAGRQAMLRSMKADAARNPTEYGAKLAGDKPSLVESIAPTVPESEADEFVDSIANDPALRVTASGNEAFQKLALAIASCPRQSVEKTASALVDSIKPTVVQFEKLASGDFKVKWANAGAFAPQEGTVGPDQAASMAGADLSGAQPGATVTVSTEKAQKTNIDEPVFIQAQEFGHYQVQNMDSNEMLSGWVVPIIDFDMQPMELFVFSAGQAWAVQDEIAGQLQPMGAEGLQAMFAPPQGSGVFIHLNEAGVGRCLLPMTIQNMAQDPEGGQQIMAETMFGEPVTLTLAPGLQNVQQIGDQEYALPDTFQWLPLPGEPVFLAKQPLDVEQVAQAKAMPSQVQIGSSGQGEFSLDGAPVEKVARDQRWFVKRAQAEFLLVGMGMNPFDARTALDKAEASGLAKVAGLRSITPLADVHKDMVKKAAKTLEAFDYNLRRNLVKEAAVLDDSETADKVLAMNFINPENIGIFAGYLPELDAAVSKLAEMLVGARLGLKQVDEGAIERAMKNLEQVIEGLKALQQRELV